MVDYRPIIMSTLCYAVWWGLVDLGFENFLIVFIYSSIMVIATNPHQTAIRETNIHGTQSAKYQNVTANTIKASQPLDEVSHAEQQSHTNIPHPTCQLFSSGQADLRVFQISWRQREKTKKTCKNDDQRQFPAWPDISSQAVTCSVLVYSWTRLVY